MATCVPPGRVMTFGSYIWFATHMVYLGIGSKNFTRFLIVRVVELIGMAG